MSTTSYPQSDVISVERQDHVAVVWLDRADKRNAMAPGFWTDFPAIMDALGEDSDVRAIVIAAKGASFTVGLDLMAFGPPLKPSYHRFKRELTDVMSWDRFDPAHFLDDDELDQWIKSRRHRVMYRDGKNVD